MTGKAKKPPTDAQMKAKAVARWDNEGGAPQSGDVSARKQHKRPRDANQLAKRIVDIATGERDDDMKKGARANGSKRPVVPNKPVKRPKSAD
jgi:hypothetical protein